MSWDIFVVNLPDDIQSVEEIPEDFTPPPIGERTRVLSTLKSVFGDGGESEDDTWFDVTGDGYSLNISVSERDPVRSMAFFVYGSNPVVVQKIDEFLSRLGVRAFDTTAENGLFNREKSLESFEKFKAYRDQVISSGERE